MTKEEALELFAEVVDCEVTELTDETVLDDLEGWDSVSKLGFIAMSRRAGKKISSDQLRGFTTVADVVAALAD